MDVYPVSDSDFHLRIARFAAYGKVMRILPSMIALFMTVPTHLLAAEPFRIGVSAPLSGPYQVLGQQIVQGAESAAAKLGSIEIVTADDRCDSEGGLAAAQELKAKKVSVTIGYLCTPALLAALPVFRDIKTPLISLGARGPNILADAAKNGDTLLRLAPGSQAEGDAAASLLLPTWRGKSFAIVDDGTIHARELAEQFRLAAESQGLKPAFVDTFRPATDNQISLVTRLKRSGVTHVFVGGDRDDISVLARDAAARGLALTIAGGEALASADGEVPLADGVLMVGLAETAIADLNAKGAAPAFGSGYASTAYAAVEIAVASRGDAPFSIARGLRLETRLGKIGFDEAGELLDNRYRLFVSRAGNFEEFQ
jgi:branched-chain amino acid transport system substrate-binding protein